MNCPRCSGAGYSLSKIPVFCFVCKCKGRVSPLLWLYYHLVCLFDPAFRR